MKTHGGLETRLHSFISLVTAARHFLSDTRWIGGWMGQRAGLNGLEKTKFLPISGIDLHSSSRWLIRLIYDIEGGKMPQCSV
jgi:hypothetical protein